VGFAPLGRDRGDGRRPLAQRERRSPWCVADRRFHDGHRGIAGEERAQHAGEIGLRLERDDAAAEGGEGASAIAGVRADIEYEIAVGDETRVELAHAPLAAGDAVVDCERAGEPDKAIEARH